MQGTASRDDAGPVSWDFPANPAGRSIPDNVILRERPEDASDGDRAWLINNRGEIQTTLDGIYLFLGYGNPVIWNVPYGTCHSSASVSGRPLAAPPILRVS